jgi:aminoglycoside phosphotransferase (APT) family kinase protein
MTTVDIDDDLVRRLVDAQFPQYAGLGVRRVEPGGNDNRTFRLGDELGVRLPSAEGYVASVAKEQRWLAQLAPRLPVPIPEPVGAGVPGEGYPWPWTINRWLDGETLITHRHTDRDGLARDLAAVIRALHAIDATNGPAAGAHSFYRGAPPAYYDAETIAALEALGDRVDVAAALAIWRRALESQWDAPPVWFHGDIAHGNLLMRDGRLAALIDFGTSGVGDPACDLVIAWTYFEGDERRLLRDEVGLDDETWHRARGWALWKALTTEAAAPGASTPVLAAILDDPVV